jgi:lipopolysaccharide transport system permease protein
LLSIIILGTTIGLALTPIGMLFSDIGKAIPIIMQFLMYFSPIVFPVPQKGIAATIFNLNPLTPFFMTARDILIAQPPEYLSKFIFFSFLIVPFLILFWTIYRVSLPILIERMSA